MNTISKDSIIQGVVVNPKNECWEWKKARTKAGYGQIRKGAALYTHRISYALWKGEIPAGMRVLHKCDNPPCCNPDHLFLGTQLDNIQDCIAKGRAAFAEDHGLSMLTNAQVQEIRRRITGGPRGTARSIARELNVSESLISQMKNRKTYASVL